MRRNIIFIILFIFILPIFKLIAQNKKIDSFQQTLYVVKEDTTRLRLLNNLSSEFTAISNYDTSLLYISKAKNLAEKLLTVSSLK